MAIDKLRSAWVNPNQDGLKEAVVAIYPSVELRYEERSATASTTRRSLQIKVGSTWNCATSKQEHNCWIIPSAAEIKEKRWFLDLINDITQRTGYSANVFLDVPPLCGTSGTVRETSFRDVPERRHQEN